MGSSPDQPATRSRAARARASEGRLALGVGDGRRFVEEAGRILRRGAARPGGAAARAARTARPARRRRPGPGAGPRRAPPVARPPPELGQQAAQHGGGDAGRAGVDLVHGGGGVGHRSRPTPPLGGSTPRRRPPPARGARRGSRRWLPSPARRRDGPRRRHRGWRAAMRAEQPGADRRRRRRPGRRPARRAGRSARRRGRRRRRARRRWPTTPATFMGSEIGVAHVWRSAAPRRDLLPRPAGLGQVLGRRARSARRPSGWRPPCSGRRGGIGRCRGGRRRWRAPPARAARRRRSRPRRSAYRSCRYSSSCWPTGPPSRRAAASERPASSPRPMHEPAPLDGEHRLDRGHLALLAGGPGGHGLGGLEGAVDEVGGRRHGGPAAGHGRRPQLGVHHGAGIVDRRCRPAVGGDGLGVVPAGAVHAGDGVGRPLVEAGQAQRRDVGQRRRRARGRGRSGSGRPRWARGCGSRPRDRGRRGSGRGPGRSPP